MNSSPITGGCLCGFIRYAASGKPYNITHCHCADCRRASGAPFVTWASFRRTDLHFTSGVPREIPWAERVRSFCPQCGTQLTFMVGPGAAEIDLTVSSFDNPSLVTPEDHTWVEDRLPWIALSDGLPAYPRVRDSHPV